jgi:uncharacterized membrane protein
MNPHTIFVRDLIRPVGALAVASALGCSLLALRVVLIGHARQFYLVWNLFLAWMPLVFALAAVCLAQTSPHRRTWFLAAAAAWLLFFPNAPYILTDLIHLGPTSHTRFWTDLVLILIFALIGLVLGFLSLFLMQRLVARRYGWPVGWLFVGVVAALSGFGIYAGRFFRWNSWDVIFNPLDLLNDTARWLLSIPHSPRALVIPILFAALFLIAYTILYALTHLPAALPVMGATGPGRVLARSTYPRPQGHPLGSGPANPRALPAHRSGFRVAVAPALV